MENKQTAVEWLKIKLPSLFEHDDNGFYEKLFEQAKQMEKEQIIKANRDGIDMCIEQKSFITGEQYYNETFNP